MHADRYKYLYRRYLRGECTREEFDEIKRYFASLDNADALTSVEEILAAFPDDIPLDPARSEEILNYILAPKSSRIITLRKYAKYAAAASLLLAGFLAVYNKLGRDGDRKETVSIAEYHNTSHENRRVLLKDGSSIYLKPGARLGLLTDFEHDSARHVVLTGEAFFAIARNEQKPFTIKSRDDVQIQVLGTRFNANVSEKGLSVVLTEGSVKVKNENRQILLSPEQMLKYDVEDNTFSLHKVDTSYYNAWIANRLYFKDNTLASVLTRLNDAYPDSRLSLAQKYHHLRFTGYLPADNLDRAIEILEKSFDYYNLTIIKYKQ